MEKNSCYGRDQGRDLVINTKLAQFLTDRGQNDTKELKMLPGVPWAKKIEKGGEKNSCYGRDQGEI